MAKIAKYGVSILGTYFELPINCSSKGEFSTVFPMEYRSIGNYKSTHPSKLELEKEIDRYVREINEAARTVDLIIAYRLSNRVSPFASSAPDSAITISWRAYVVETTGKKKSYNTLIRTYPDYTPPEEKFICEGFMKGNYTYPSERDNINPEKDHTIPFTPEAYEFFEKSVKAVEAIYERLQGFLNPEVIQQTISGSFNLLNSNNSE